MDLLNESVKRTAETKYCRAILFSQSSASRTPYQINGILPALKRWAIFIQSASRTTEKYFLQHRLITDQKSERRGNVLFRCACVRNLLPPDQADISRSSDVRHSTH